MQQFWKHGYDPEEFATVLQSYYRQSNGSTDEVLFGDTDAPSLILKWKRNGSIDALLPGPAFVDADVVRLREVLAASLEQSGSVVRRFLVTTYRPLIGALGYEDWFALLPAPTEAPRPPDHAGGGHPAVLEVQVRGSADSSIVFRRARLALLELEALFAALTKERVASQPGGVRFHWVLDPDRSDRVVYAQTNYQVSAFAVEAPALSDIGPYADIEHVDINRYYAPGFHGSAIFAVPATFPSLLNQYRKLDAQQQERFRRGAYWAKLTGELWHVSKAAAYAATVRAIEALMPAAPSGPPCQSCGERPGRGTRKAFARFVDQLTDGTISEKQRLQFYDRRSRLVHGDQLFGWDENLISSGPRELGEMSDLQTIDQLAHIVFHNWLSGPT